MKELHISVERENAASIKVIQKNGGVYERSFSFENEAPISIVSFLKAGTAATVSGAMSVISTTPISATLSVPPFLMRWRQRSALPLIR